MHHCQEARAAISRHFRLTGVGVQKSYGRRSEQHKSLLRQPVKVNGQKTRLLYKEAT